MSVFTTQHKKTPPKYKPFQTKGGPWSQVNTEKLPEPRHGWHCTCKKQNSPSPCLSFPRILRITSSTVFYFIWCVLRYSSESASLSVLQRHWRKILFFFKRPFGWFFFFLPAAETNELAFIFNEKHLLSKHGLHLVRFIFKVLLILTLKVHRTNVPPPEMNRVLGIYQDVPRQW